MKAGAARIDITPPPGRLMAGFGSRTEPARGVHDALFARALVLEGSGGCVALVAADLISVPERIQAAAAEVCATRCGTLREQIQFAGTHTHGGPGFPDTPHGGTSGIAKDDAYEVALVQSLAAVVEEAWRSRREALAAVGTGALTGIGKNRRHPDGPVDNDVTVLRVDGADGQPIATLMNYSCHPTTLGPDNLLYTADYPGVACAEVDRVVSGVAIFTTGAQGNVNPGGYSAEGSMIGQVVPWRNYDSAQKYGREVARVALEVRARLVPAPSDRVWGRGRTLVLPRKTLPSAEGAGRQAAAALADLDRVRVTGSQAEVQAAQIAEAYAQITLRQAMSPDREVPVQMRLGVLALGPALHVSIPGELFAELGLRIKQGLGQGSTFVSVLTDGSGGYFPTREAFAEGGYEPAASLLNPGGGEEIAEAAIALGLA